MCYTKLLYEESFPVPEVDNYFSVVLKEQKMLVIEILSNQGRWFMK